MIKNIFVGDESGHRVAAPKVAKQDYSSEDRYQKWKAWTYCAERYFSADGYPDKKSMDRECGSVPYFDGTNDARRRLYGEDTEFKARSLNRSVEFCYGLYSTKKARDRCVVQARTRHQ